MISLLLALVACEPQAPWTLPTDPETPMATVPLDGSQMTVVQRFGPPTAMMLVDDLLLWSDGGALHRGDQVVDTPGFTMGLSVVDGVLWVADARHGLQRRDLQTLRWIDTPFPGDARAVHGDYGVLAEGWLVRLSTGMRVAVDGATLTGVRGWQDDWMVGAVDGLVVQGRGAQAAAISSIPVRSLVRWGDRMALWTNGNQLVDLDGVPLHESVTGLAPGDPPWWSGDSQVRRLGTNVARSRVGRSVAMLSEAPNGVLVAWDDGLIEQLDDDVKVVRTWRFELPTEVPKFEPAQDSALSIGPPGLLHADWTGPVSLPGGMVPHEFFENERWSVAFSWTEGGLVAVAQDGRRIRQVLPGMPNGGVFVGDLFLTGLGVRGAAAIDLSNAEKAPMVVDLVAHSWQIEAWVCTDGVRTLLTWEEQGVYELAVVGDSLEIVGQIETPGVAAFCTWNGEFFEVFDTTGRVQIRLGPGVR